MKKPIHVAVIGAGAAGMMAAITARRSGARVTLLERQDRVGRKVLSTGNGRCNFTNTGGPAERYHGADPGFCRPALQQFPPDQAIEFFHSLGVCHIVEGEGKVFPRTGQASTVLDALRNEIGRLGLTVRLQAAVQRIERQGASFLVEWTPGQEDADRVIVTAGGRAMPHLGGREDGLTLLEKLGHTTVPIFPALVPLKTSLPFNRQLKGVKVEAAAHLEIDGIPTIRDAGEVLFTEYGLSGPPIIQLSQAANQARLQGRAVSITLDLFPDWNEAALTAELEYRRRERPEAAPDAVLAGLVHKRLVPALLAEAGFPQTLKRWKFEITGSLSWNEAHVMSGGISTRDFSAETLESRLAPGLFAAGEVLDITGDCGGFNLQWAWASGRLAGRQAATA
jgi:predicted Rossmann fold flavoprotein